MLSSPRREVAMTQTSENIKKLINDLIDAGCDPMAVGEGYVVNEPEDADTRQKIQDILHQFGPRLHLLAEISSYIRSLGRFHDP